jgi:chloride channel 3/4/5
VSLDIRSPMDLVYECFVKLGLRYVCVTKDGRFAGVVSCPACLVGYNALTISQTHKKTFVRYMRDLEEKEVDH